MLYNSYVFFCLTCSSSINEIELCWKVHLSKKCQCNFLSFHWREKVCKKKDEQRRFKRSTKSRAWRKRKRKRIKKTRIRSTNKKWMIQIEHRDCFVSLVWQVAQHKGKRKNVCLAKKRTKDSFEILFGIYRVVFIDSHYLDRYMLNMFICFIFPLPVSLCFNLFFYFLLLVSVSFYSLLCGNRWRNVFKCD